MGEALNTVVRKCPVCKGEWAMFSYKIIAEMAGDDLLWSGIKIICPNDDDFTLVRAVKDKFVTREVASIIYCRQLQFQAGFRGHVDREEWGSLFVLLTQWGFSAVEAEAWIALEKGESLDAISKLFDDNRGQQDGDRDTTDPGQPRREGSPD